MSDEILVSFAKKAYSPTQKDYKSFKTAKGPFGNVGNFLCKEVWSPIVWRDGQRAKENFASTTLAALDFDSGVWSLEKAIDIFDSVGLAFVVGTTKSHQLVKDNALPCDRFRVVLLAEPCTSRLDYECTMKNLMETVPCDKSCKDGARYFFPCKEVIFTKTDGHALKWKKSLPPRPRTTVAYSKGEMPWWIRDWINNGAPQGERHLTCYKIGAELARIGYEEVEITSKILRGPLALIGEHDVIRATRNGIAAAKGEVLR